MTCQRGAALVSSCFSKTKENVGPCTVSPINSKLLTVVISLLQQMKQQAICYKQAPFKPLSARWRPSESTWPCGQVHTFSTAHIRPSMEQRTVCNECCIARIAAWRFRSKRLCIRVVMESALLRTARPNKMYNCTST